ncbi:hypothetical protein TrVFT333_011756 [Trichoderma virens FT-333]|nr:hypothetical protein TrVFT333_011756 [Trichoderma virens FT-333]
METIARILLGLALACFANALNHDPVERSSPTPPTPPWRGSAVLSYDSSYETPTPSIDEYSSPDPYSFEETWYPPSSAIEPSTTPRPQYSAIVTVRTTTWVISRSTTITSVVLETYYSTLTDFESSDEGGMATQTEIEPDPSASAPCAAASGNPSGYGNECSSSSSSSSTSSSVGAMTTITWSPEVTAYPPPSVSSEGGASPASTSATSSASSTTATERGAETPPVVTGAAASPLRNADTRALGAVAALLAILA